MEMIIYVDYVVYIIWSFQWKLDEKIEKKSFGWFADGGSRQIWKNGAFAESPLGEAEENSRFAKSQGKSSRQRSHQHGKISSFAESSPRGSRQRLFFLKKIISLQRALLEALGKDFFKKKILFAESLAKQLSAKSPSVVTVTFLCRELGFGSRQTLCREPDG